MVIKKSGKNVVPKEAVALSPQVVEKSSDWLSQKSQGVFLTMLVGIVLIIGVAVFSVAILPAQTAPGACSVNSSSLDAKVCSANKAMTVDLVPILSCGTGSCTNTPGKITLLAFHSPTCTFCDAQEPVLNKIKGEFSNVDIKYVCMSVSAGDEALCQANADGKYMSYTEGLKLLDQYQSLITGTPGIVIDCKYLRIGSLAIQDKQQNTTKEYNDLKALVQSLS